jgi:hypothetical protein
MPIKQGLRAKELELICNTSVIQEQGKYFASAKCRAEVNKFCPEILFWKQFECC